MKSLKFLLASSLIVLMAALGTQANMSLAEPVYAQTTSQPQVTLTYTPKSSHFLVVAKNVQKVTYTIEYTRTSGSKEMLEGLQGGGKATKGVFARRHFAGTQSSKYFIPHKVKGGTLIMKGTTSGGKAFSKKVPFTIINGKLVVGK